jgi:hypothetical protein
MLRSDWSIRPVNLRPQSAKVNRPELDHLLRRAKVKPFDERLSVSEAAHVPGPGGETAEPGWAVETRRAMETR